VSLRDITARLLEALELAESGEYSPEAVAGTLDALEWELEEKADAYARAIRHIEAEGEAIAAEIERLSRRRQAGARKTEALKAGLMQAMRAAGKTKLRTDLHSFGIRRTPPAVEITDGAALPAEYMAAPEPRPDKARIREALKAGAEVPGARLASGEALAII